MSIKVMRPRPRDYASLFWMMMRKRILLWLRYPVDTAAGQVTAVILFAGIFFGGKAFGISAMTGSVSEIVTGYFLWQLSLTAFNGLSRSITKESQWGTLEQLYMSPIGFNRVMAVKSAVYLITAIIWASPILFSMLLITGTNLSINLATVVPLVVLSIAPAFGVGFLTGGLAVRFKRVSNVFSILRFLLVALIAAPVGKYPALKWLPLSQGSYLLQQVMANHVPLGAIPEKELVILVTTAAVYPAAGFVIFHYCQRSARKAGVMGDY